ncbi:MAG: hypothetical protein WBW54_15890, partial [Candidatus Acidiferrales bacterium]
NRQSCVPAETESSIHQNAASNTNIIATTRHKAPMIIGALDQFRFGAIFQYPPYRKRSLNTVRHNPTEKPTDFIRRKMKIAQTFATRANGKAAIKNTLTRQGPIE